MNRIFQSILGSVLLLAAVGLAASAVTSKGAVVIEWPLASIILVLAAIGGHLISKSLWTDAAKNVAQVLRARKSKSD